MLIYLIFAIVFLSLLFIYKKDQKILIPIMLLLVLNAFRGYSVGTDYRHYYDDYTSSVYKFFVDDLDVKGFVGKVGSDKSNEWGWGLLNYLGVKAALPFWFVNLLVVSLILFFIYGMIRKQSPHFFFSIYLFLMLDLFFPSFNIMRHSIAIAIFAYSLRYINENKPVIYFLFCLLASMFHTSALMLPLLYFLKYIKINPVSSVLLLSSSFVILIQNWDESIMNFFFDKNILSIYSVYAFQEAPVLNAMGTLVTIVFLVIPTVVFLYCCLLLKGCSNIYMKLWLVGMLIQNLTMNYGWLFRMSGYFLIAQIIALPLVIDSDQLGSKLKKLSFSIIIAYSVIFYLYRVMIGADGILPYTTLLN